MYGSKGRHLRWMKHDNRPARLAKTLSKIKNKAHFMTSFAQAGLAIHDEKSKFGILGFVSSCLEKEPSCTSGHLEK